MKMKMLVYKPASLLLGALLLTAWTVKAQELSKEFSKEYSAAKGATLDLSNKYGDVKVHSTTGDKVVINVKVTLTYPNRDRAEKLLSYIDVEFTESAEGLSAKTVIDDSFSFTGWSGDSRKFSIDYNVEMPEWMSLKVANRYGNTDLDSRSGLTNLDIKYGNLTATSLKRGAEKPYNSIAISYGKATIEEAGWLSAVLRYSSNFTLDKCQALLLDSRYSKLYLGELSSIVADTKYDNINIETINNLVVETGYAQIVVGTLNKKLVLDAGYGSVTVGNIPEGFESIEVDSKYTSVRLGVNENASYSIDAKTSYCSLKYNEENYSNRNRVVSNNSTEITGVIGKDEKPASTVLVRASYGSVKLI